jgi:intraflagellar transport protein 20
MADGQAGLHFDELSKVRLLDAELSARTQEMKEECKDFVEKMTTFQNLVGGFIGTVNKLSNAVEAEKLKAIGSRNLLKSITKQREAQKQQLQALISEKKVQLERYRIEYESLLKRESEQNEFIEQFMLQN